MGVSIGTMKRCHVTKIVLMSTDILLIAVWVSTVTAQVSYCESIHVE